MVGYMTLGDGHLMAPEFILGTFSYGGGTSWRDTTNNDSELVELLRDAYEMGVRGLDTAPVYGVGRSERIVGQAIKGRREKYYIQTKCSLNWRSKEGSFTYTRDGKDVYNDFSSSALVKDVEDSLKRLDTEYIDVMIVHRCPPIDQMGMVMETLETLKDRGLILGIGLSNVGQTSDPETSLRTFASYGQLDLLQESGSLLKKDYTKKMVNIKRQSNMSMN